MRQTILCLLLCSVFFANAQFKNQTEILSKYSNGNYTVYRNDQGKLDKVNKQWPITINRSSDNLIESIVVKRAGVVDETFVPDLKEQPGYFAYEANKLISLVPLWLFNAAVR